MTCGRALLAGREQPLDGAAVSHSADLVRGDCLARLQGPAFAPAGPLPKGENGSSWHSTGELPKWKRVLQ